MEKEIERPPTKKLSKEMTHSPPKISLADGEVKLLIEMSNGKRLNVNNYSDYNKIARSTTRTRLKKLDRIGLVNDKFAEKTITTKGLIYLKNTNRIGNNGVVGSRQEGRKEQLSTHWHKFKLKIESKPNFLINRLKKLNYLELKENKLTNLYQIILTLNDAKIIINPKQVIISLFDTITDNSDDSDIKCLDRALEYAQRLREIGLETSELMLEEGHWARIESKLADWLYQNVDKRYYLELEGGKKFWIDCSGRKRPEDETNDKVVRQNIDESLDLLGNGKIKLSDINLLKQDTELLKEIAINNTISTNALAKIESLRVQERISENNLKTKQLELNRIETEFTGIPNYIG